MKTINIETKDGKIKVPASDLIDEIPNFSVTMTNFGLFEVTHNVSGWRVSGEFERAINAYLFMANLQIAINELGINSSLCGSLFRDELIQKDKKCQSIGMSITNWINFHKVSSVVSGEFPCEGGDDSPHHKMKIAMEKLKNQP